MKTTNSVWAAFVLWLIAPALALRERRSNERFMASLKAADAFGPRVETDEAPSAVSMLRPEPCPISEGQKRRLFRALGSLAVERDQQEQLRQPRAQPSSESGLSEAEAHERTAARP